MNEAEHGKRRGWVRASRHASEETQRKMLQRHHVSPIYSDKEHGLAALLNSLRPGNEVWVTTMGRLSPHRRDLKRAIETIHSKKCIIVEAASERRSNRARDAAAMTMDAVDELVGDARALPTKQAREFGSRGGQANARKIAEAFAKRRMALPEAQKLWVDTDLAKLSNHQVLKRMPGWTQGSAYRRLGPRGLGKGRPRSDGSLPERSRPGRVYFLQNGKRRMVKIGFSGDHEGRVSNIQNATPDRLKLLATVRGKRALEADLHKRFAEYRVRGEWFRLEGALAEYVNSLKPDKD